MFGLSRLGCLEFPTHFGKYIFNNHVSIEAMTTWRIKPSGTNCLPEEISIVTENVNGEHKLSHSSIANSKGKV
jgi:hypothetical protein